MTLKAVAVKSTRRIGGRGAEDRKWTRSVNPPQVPSLASSPRPQAGQVSRGQAGHEKPPARQRWTSCTFHIPNGSTAQTPADGGGRDQMGGADSPPTANF